MVDPLDKDAFLRAYKRYVLSGCVVSLFAPYFEFVAYERALAVLESPLLSRTPACAYAVLTGLAAPLISARADTQTASALRTPFPTMR